MHCIEIIEIYFSSDKILFLAIVFLYNSLIEPFIREIRIKIIVKIISLRAFAKKNKVVLYKYN